MQAWTAARMIGEAAAHGAAPATPTPCAPICCRPEFALAAFKGQKLTLRDWNLQLRQPILLSDGRNVVSRFAAGGIHAPVLRTRHARARPTGDEMQVRMMRPRRVRARRCSLAAPGACADAFVSNEKGNTVTVVDLDDA